jgi:endonuclease YncB( thermonuclease family)
LPSPSEAQLLIACLTVLLSASSIFAGPTFADFLGPVVSVLDGDTIEVLHNTRPERVRLSGIDCPEKGQVFGKKAK